jgi:uncharacterized protein (TIGR04255 family)
VFPNAPLQLVAVEVTYPATNTTFDTALFGALGEVLGPNSETQIAGQIRVAGPPGADGGLPGEAMLFRMTSSDRTVSVSAWPTSLIVECSEYERFEVFRDLVRAVVDAYVAFIAPDGVSRFGMRYIDEVHVPAPVTSVADWAPYVDSRLIAPAELVEKRVSSLATGFTVDLGEHRTVNVRCTTTSSRAMSSEGHLVLRERPDTPALVLDIDAIFQPPSPQLTPVTGALVAELAEGLRPAVRDVFDAAFTEAALETFRTVEETA